MASSLQALAECNCSPCDGQVYTVESSSTTVSVGVFRVDIVADLRPITSAPTNLLAYAIGLLVKEDASGGWYSWEALSADPDDGITLIKADDGGGEWHKRI